MVVRRITGKRRPVLSHTFVGKAIAVGDQRTRLEVTTRARQAPIFEEESTTVYAQ